MKRIEQCTNAELIALYIEAAQGYEQALARASSTDANRQQAAVDRVYGELLRRGGENELLPLLAHESPIVQQAAAAYALRFAPEQAVPVLEALAEHGAGIPKLNAVVTLHAWRERTPPS